MHIRIATSGDWEQIKDAHRRANYGFKLPGMLFGTHLVEEDGQIIAAAGYQPVAQVVAVVEPDCVSPHKRLEALKALHTPLARLVLEAGFDSVFAFCDPQFRSFDKRLMKLGWSRKIWPCCFLEREEIERAYLYETSHSRKILAES